MTQVVVRLLSSIGRPADQPQLVTIEIVANGGLSPAQQQLVRELVRQRLTDLPTLVKELATGTVPVFQVSILICPYPHTALATQRRIP